MIDLFNEQDLQDLEDLLANLEWETNRLVVSEPAWSYVKDTDYDKETGFDVELVGYKETLPCEFTLNLLGNSEYLTGYENDCHNCEDWTNYLREILDYLLCPTVTFNDSLDKYDDFEVEIKFIPTVYSVSKWETGKVILSVRWDFERKD